MTGKHGVGKTIAGHLIVRGILASNPTMVPVFLYAKKVLEQALRMSSGGWDQKEAALMAWEQQRNLADNDDTVWMIDDLGKEYVDNRDGTLAAIQMEDIINRIHARRGRVIITSNLEADRMKTIYGGQMMSRFGERGWMWCYNFKGTDLPDARRQTEQQAQAATWRERLKTNARIITLKPFVIKKSGAGLAVTTMQVGDKKKDDSFPLVASDNHLTAVQAMIEYQGSIVYGGYRFVRDGAEERLRCASVRRGALESQARGTSYATVLMTVSRHAIRGPSQRAIAKFL